MKRVMKVALFLMAMLTVVYAGLVVYANSNSGYLDAAYVAGEYKSEKPATDWYTPEQLGIVEIIEHEYGENDTYWLVVVVDREKEPFPLFSTIFKYKDKFYQISQREVLPWLPESVKHWQILAGVGIGAGWVFVGAMFLRERKKTR